MMRIVEISLVLGAWLLLISSGVISVKSAIRFGKSIKRFFAGIEPKTSDLFEQADQANRRAFNIMETRDTLFVRLGVVRASLAQLLVSLRVLIEIRKKASYLLDYVGR